MDVRRILAGNTAGGNTQYSNFRIPGAVVTKRDTLILYFEARTAPEDWADMDIVAFRSDDGGETFSGPTLLAEGAARGKTVNNPVMIVGNDGTLHFLYCVEYGVCAACGGGATSRCPHGVGVFYRKSTDDGLTWSAPVNISDGTAPLERYVFALGPGHGICLPDGTLVVPVWMVLRGNEADENATQPLFAHHCASISTLYSRSNGTDWQLGEILPNLVDAQGKPADHNETMGAVTSDGGVLLSVRTHDVGCRALARSRNGYSGWTPLRYEPALPDAVCMGSVLACKHEEAPHSILHVNCENPIRSRKNLVLKASRDDGVTWTLRKVIEPGDAGYSDLAVDSHGTIYVLYEVKAGKTCNLARVRYEEMEEL